jgi:putative beta-barrel porin BBP2
MDNCGVHPRTLAIALLVLAPVGAVAQTLETGAPPTTVRVHIGPLYLNPTIGLTGAGVDDNVFYEPDQTAKSDYTATLSPATDLWLRFGPSWINGSVREDLVYYQKYASERSANSSFKVNWVIPLNRLTLNPGVSYLFTRARPGFEIDTRSQRTELDYNGSLELRVASKTFLGVRADRRTTDFDQAARFLGSSLHDQLNRKATTSAVTVRHQATPLTSIMFDVSREQDRFDFSPDRDTDSIQITGGVKFDPAALIKGAATFGYRDFKPASASVPGYQGSTSAVDLSYVALGTTRLAMTATRDVQYSYDINQPYYLQTGVTGSIGQQIFGPLDVVGRIGAQRLDYRDRAGAVVASPNRVDHIKTYGAGLGYHLGRDMRIGFNVDQQNRDSPLAARQYKGLVYGFAVTYGS